MGIWSIHANCHNLIFTLHKFLFLKKLSFKKKVLGCKQARINLQLVRIKCGTVILGLIKQIWKKGWNLS